ncbi:hypothetical protein L5515_009600 [Caenorhabditis briggsae]|uniref:Mos1 transposase HTH domain-containing protein n=1 Tax=Caenorhabditis briggsae TaxID=6238 RepID=A0AAE9FDA3_CAEBR|nr:hypothetical protein L5515_009600 [Caenorhabditis briggsae]
MEASPRTIKENHYYLKACILYEVLQKKPILDSYRNFCNTVGQNTMEYPDFEFWYYCLFKIIKLIAGHLDPVERTHLRAINHAIKNSFPPAFEIIEIVVSDMSLYWKLNNTVFSCKKKAVAHYFVDLTVMKKEVRNSI